MTFSAGALFSLLKLTTRVNGERIHTFLSNDEMQRLLTDTGWREDARTVGAEFGMPRMTADASFMRLTRTDRDNR
jgi:hypothetical protein